MSILCCSGKGKKTKGYSATDDEHSEIGAALRPIDTYATELRELNIDELYNENKINKEMFPKQRPTYVVGDENELVGETLLTYRDEDEGRALTINSEPLPPVNISFPAEKWAQVILAKTPRMSDSSSSKAKSPLSAEKPLSSEWSTLGRTTSSDNVKATR